MSSSKRKVGYLNTIHFLVSNFDDWTVSYEEYALHAQLEDGDSVTEAKVKAEAVQVPTSGIAQLSSIPLEDRDIFRGAEIDILCSDHDKKLNWTHGVICAINKQDGKLLIHVSGQAAK